MAHDHFKKLLYQYISTNPCHLGINLQKKVNFRFGPPIFLLKNSKKTNPCHLGRNLQKKGNFRFGPPIFLFSLIKENKKIPKKQQKNKKSQLERNNLKKSNFRFGPPKNHIKQNVT